MIVDIHAHIGHHPIMDFRQTPEEVLEAMDKWGIDRTFVLPFPSMKVRKVNDAVAEAVKRHPDRLTGFAVIDPSGEGALEEVRHAADIGLRGVMLDPEFHRVFGVPRLEEVMVPCMEYNMPVLFNTPNIEVGEGESMGREPYYQGINQLASRYPDVKLLVSPFWPRVRELMRKYCNLLIDSGGRNGISGAISLTQEMGPTRVFFGSESPQNHPALGIKQICTMKLFPVYRELILGKNAERIFKDIF